MGYISGVKIRKKKEGSFHFEAVPISTGLALGTILYPLKLVSTRHRQDNQWKHDSEFAKIIKKCMTQVLYPYIQDID